MCVFGDLVVIFYLVSFVVEVRIEHRGFDATKKGDLSFSNFHFSMANNSSYTNFLLSV